MYFISAVLKLFGPRHFIQKIYVHVACTYAYTIRKLFSAIFSMSYVCIKIIPYGYAIKI